MLRDGINIAQHFQIKGIYQKYKSKVYIKGILRI